MNNQNNDASISDTDLDNVSGGWGGIVARMAAAGGPVAGNDRMTDIKSQYQQMLIQLSGQ